MTNDYKILELLEVKEEVAFLIKSKNIKLELTTYSIVLTLNGASLAYAVSTKAMELLLLGNLGPASKEQIRLSFENFAVKAVSTLYGDEGYSKNNNYADSPFSPDLMLEVPSTKAKSPPKKTVPFGSNGLANATKLYEPVSGSSINSTYYVVALGDGINIAVRYQSDRLSVRVEGAKIETYADSLVACGLSYKKGVYASAHYQALDHIIAVKTIGAILGMVGFEPFKEVGSLYEAVKL